MTVIISNVSPSNIFFKFLTSSFKIVIWSSKWFISIDFLANANISFCNSTPIIFFFVFVDKTKGIGAFPEHKSNIFWSFKFIVTKLGNKMDSKENLKWWISY